MSTHLLVDTGMLDLIRCPICKAGTRISSTQVSCANSTCQAVFPIVNKIPILINDHSSAFHIEDFLHQGPTYFSCFPKAHDPSYRIPINRRAKEHFHRLYTMLTSTSPRSHVLVLGGGIRGIGSEAILDKPGILSVETDVSFGPHTQLVCDAHDIPFADESFDAVIAQALLEHVADPWRCVEEIHRVLKPNGLIYANTPFMQQVHGGAYDFTRFTLRGHRRLFRHFSDIDSGVIGGPGMALAWAYQHFLDSWTQRPFLRLILSYWGRGTSFWLKYTDAFLMDRPGVSDGASAVYFFGRKSPSILSDRDLVRMKL